MNPNYRLKPAAGGKWLLNARDGRTPAAAVAKSSYRRWIRVGETESAKPSIVGVWRYPHIQGLIAFERFTPDGDLFFRLPMKASRGCYALEPEKNEMLMRFEEGEVKALSFTVEGTQLKIQSADDPVGTYDLSAWGAWYDIDSITIQQPGGQP